MLESDEGIEMDYLVQLDSISSSSSSSQCRQDAGYDNNIVVNFYMGNIKYNMVNIILVGSWLGRGTV